MYKFKKKVAIMLLALVAVLFTSFTNAANIYAYSLADFGEDLGSAFSIDQDEGLDLTEYQDVSITLSAEGLDSSLVFENEQGGPQGLRGFIISAVNFALGFLGLAAVIVVIYGGVMYVTAGGNDERVQTGKKSIMYATIGLVIIMGSFAFVNTLVSGLGTGEEPDSINELGFEGNPLLGSNAITGGGFNAAAEQVKVLAVDIFTKYSNLVQAVNEFESVFNDIEKLPLLPRNFPSKGEIIQFHSSVKSKLNTLSSQVPVYSRVYQESQDLIRFFDQSIDRINSYNRDAFYARSRDGAVLKCVDEERYVVIDVSGVQGAVSKVQVGDTYDTDFSTGFEAGFNDRTKCEQKAAKEGWAFAPYKEGLYVEWLNQHSIIRAFNNPESSYGFNPIVRNLQEEFVDYLDGANDQIDGALDKLAKTYHLVKEIDVVSEGQANTSYREMMQNFGYIDNLISPPLNPVTGLLPTLRTMDIENEINTTTNYVIRALQASVQLYEELRNIQFVRARLAANTVSGNAPLTVIFDASGSVDPRGGTIGGRQIYWDLMGFKSFDELIALRKDGSSDDFSTIDSTVYPNGQRNNDIMTCDEFSSPSGLPGIATTADAAVGDGTPEGLTREEQLLGETLRRCTFHQPGTYRAAVKVDSAAPNLFGPGVSILEIRVNPPSTKINLTIDPNETESNPEDDVVVMDYINERLAVNNHIVNVTLNEASDGLTFDARGTDAEQFRWNFGNNVIKEFDVGQALEKNIQYEIAGRYPVVLEVVNALGEIDRKGFTLEVGGVVARLRVRSNQESFVNQEIVFDATGSRSDLGNIDNYAWIIEPIDCNEAALPEDLDCDNLGVGAVGPDGNRTPQEGRTLSTLRHTFEAPGTYRIWLQVSDTSGETSQEEITNFKVNSQEPVALFEYRTEESSQPNLYTFDAGKSYDPDAPGITFDFNWEIEAVDVVGDATAGDPWSFEEGTSASSRSPKVQFLREGTYDVTLTVTDQILAEESTSLTQTIEVNNILDISWSEGQEVTQQLNEDGEATIEFGFTNASGSAVAYEINYGDGEVSSGNLTNSAVVNHTYDEAGQYLVRLTVFDEADNDNTIQRRVFIGDGTTPIAKIKVLVDGADVTDAVNADGALEIFKNKVIGFDAGDSQNLDGTGRRLEYSWDFGDTDRSSNRQANHKYDEVSPPAGYYTVTLTVRDADDPSIPAATDTVLIDVNSAPPTFSNIQAIPSGDLTTPVNVTVQAFGVDDPDGNVTQYKWWYYDVNAPEDIRGLQITNQAAANMIIGTNGPEGEEVTYGFGLEITDNDNNKASTEDSTLPPNTIVVENGPNDLPEARFNVDLTKVFVGNPVNLTSASTDADGQIVEYIWDLEGDGFFNNEPTDQSSIEHTYEDAKPTGYDVRLKVIDDQGGESISNPVKIFVEAVGEPPEVDFGFEALAGGGGREVKFYNNTTVDEEADAQIIATEWDFNTNTGSDVESTQADPEYTFPRAGSYQVKLTVTDSNGNVGEEIKTIKIPLVGEPNATFQAQILGFNVVFSNNSQADEGAELVDFSWDFNILVDSDGDGLSDNDSDSTLKNPIFTYSSPGEKVVRLRVSDDQGNSAETTRTVVISAPPSTPGSGGGSGGSGAGSGATPAPQGGSVKPVLITDPPSDALGQIVITDAGTATIEFDFSLTTGPVKEFSIDKNIYFDTSGNAVENDDADFKTVFPGSWTTNFDASWGKIVVKLTVVDIYGNEKKVLREIIFE